LALWLWGRLSLISDPGILGVSQEKVQIPGDRLLQWRSDQAILRVDKNLYSSVQPFLGAIVR
jgi:hypothetical protein